MSDFTAPLSLKPDFSKRFVIILLVLHGGALLLLFPLTLPLVLKLSIGLLVLASSRYTLCRQVLFINHALYGCSLYYDDISGGIRVQLQSGQETQIAPGSYSHPHLVILRVEGILEALVIFSDALDEPAFRQLRVHIRHAGNPQG